MSKIKLFSKPEIISLVAIFLVLIAVSVPNFIASLRRSRDQVRRDDLGVMEHALLEYYVDLGALPKSSEDGKVMACLKPGDAPYKDKLGQWVIDAVSCEWGKDPLFNFINGNIYVSALPRDADWQEGVEYLYMSDGARFQLFAAMEGIDEAEVNPKIVARNLSCGSRICNVGRYYGCDISKTLEQCQEEAAALNKK